MSWFLDFERKVGWEEFFFEGSPHLLLHPHPTQKCSISQHCLRILSLGRKVLGEVYSEVRRLTQHSETVYTEGLVQSLQETRAKMARWAVWKQNAGVTEAARDL